MSGFASGPDILVGSTLAPAHPPMTKRAMVAAKREISLPVANMILPFG
jgi:hypothetical protein